MTETEQVEEVQQTVQTCLQDYYKKKTELKEAKAAMKETEKEAIETEDYLAKKESLKELQADLKEMKEEALDELKSNEDHIELREDILKLAEDTALTREALSNKIAELPPEPTQLTFEFEGTVHNANIQSEQQLYIDGKLDKPV